MATVNVYAKPNITLSGITSPLSVGTPVNFTVTSDSADFSFVDDNGTLTFDSELMTVGNLNYTAGTITGVITPQVAVDAATFQWKSSQKWLGIDSNITTFDIEDNSEPVRDAEVGFGLGIVNSVQQTDCIVAGQTGTGSSSIIYGPQIPGAGTPYIKILFQDDSITGATSITMLQNRISATYNIKIINVDTLQEYVGSVGSGGNIGSAFFRVNCAGTPVPYNYITEACTLARAAGPFIEVAKTGSTNPVPVGNYRLIFQRKDNGQIVNNPFEFTVTPNP